MTKLRDLSIYGNAISNTSDIARLTNLEHLYIGNTGISDISIIKNMTDLIDFDAQYNDISNTEPISNLINLQTLNLSNNNIEKKKRIIEKM